MNEISTYLLIPVWFIGIFVILPGIVLGVAWVLIIFVLIYIKHLREVMTVEEIRWWFRDFYKVMRKVWKY